MQNLQSYKNKKKELKLTNKDIADISGIPLRTVEDFFRGAYDNPRIDTVRSIEEALGLSKPLEWTEEDKALGVGNHPTRLSEKEWKWLELRNLVIETRGEEYLETLITMIEAVVKNDKK